MPRSRLGSVIFAGFLYALVAVAMTWPLARGLAQDLPADLGDSVLNAWILGWHAEHLLRVFRGDLTALQDVWHANIFYPEPLTLAYSEHLFAQTLQILPIYIATDNLVLCYNLLFLSSFILSALGMYLFVREVTGSPWAAFVAGLIYGFAPYRVAQFPHMQVLSSQWMPFVLFGMRRYFDTQRWRSLGGAGLAWIAQNLSCGYYLLYFSPFVALYGLYEMLTRRLFFNLRTWIALSTTALIVLAATLPFVQPYLELRAIERFNPRQIEEVQRFSADLASYLYAASDLRLWGDRIAAFQRSEGELFPGFVPIVLALLGVIAQTARCWRKTRPAVEATRRGIGRAPNALARLKQLAIGVIVIFGVYHLVVVVVTTATGGFSWGDISFRWVLLPRALWRVILSVLLLHALLPRLRRTTGAFLCSVPGFAAIAAILALWLSLGPLPTVMGEELKIVAPYFWLYEYVPGFDGVRVPARYAMIFTMFLAILGGFGVLDILRRGRTWLAATLTAFFLVEATAVPIRINDIEYRRDIVTPPAQLMTGGDIPLVYRYLKMLPADSAVVEMPFGVWVADLQYMYYSTVHLKPLVNGYSGYFPPHYEQRRQDIGRFDREPGRGWNSILTTGATHVLVHEAAYLDEGGARTLAALRSLGARRIARFGTDYLFEVPRSDQAPTSPQEQMRVLQSQQRGTASQPDP